MRVVNNLSWRIAGEAGQGIISGGLQLFGKACQRGGLNIFTTAEYPSLIRGGHNYIDVRVSVRGLDSQAKHPVLVLALDQLSVDIHAKEVVPGGGIIFDPDHASAEGAGLFPVPLQKLAEESGNHLSRNVVGIGASFGLLGCGIEFLETSIKDNFKAKGEDVIDSNIKAAKLGHNFAKENFKEFSFRLEFPGNNENILLSGNQAIATGAIQAGCTFYSAYPMTPASNILHTIAKHERDFGIVVKHTEDEIAAINMAIGASFAGARAMTGSSGGGFSLMVEGFGLAAQTETPLVVAEVMRPGPASGMATHSGQGDLRFVLHAAADEFQRVVIAPGDVEECYRFTKLAFKLAEKHQLPVVLLLDKYLGESYKTVPQFQANGQNKREMIITEDPEDYLRFRDSPTGTSPRTVPGVAGGEFVVSSYEHSECGVEEEDKQNRVMMHKKRHRKLDSVRNEIPLPELLGPEKADITILSWGSAKGPIKEAMRLLDKEGIKTNFLQIIFLSPFPSEQVREVIGNAKQVVIVEGNLTSQLNSLIHEHCLIDVENKILRFDGRPFNPEDIRDEINKILRPSRRGYSGKTGDY